MRISTTTDVLARRFGNKKAIGILAESGFDCMDYSMFFMFDNDHPLNNPGYETYALDLFNTAKENGIVFNQSHAPFPSVPAPNEKYGNIVRSIEVASILGAAQIIIHPITVIGNNAETLKVNLEFYNSLEKYAKKFNIKIALENMFWGDTKGGNCVIRPGACGTSEWFCQMYDLLDSDCFTCCADIGHAGLVGETADKMITSMGHDRVGALHVHDNNYLSDQHLMPFLGKLDWAKITKALHDINYKGDLTLEADYTLTALPDECLEAASRLMCVCARTLAKMIENG